MDGRERGGNRRDEEGSGDLYNVQGDSGGPLISRGGEGGYSLVSPTHWVRLVFKTTFSCLVSLYDF